MKARHGDAWQRRQNRGITGYVLLAAERDERLRQKLCITWKRSTMAARNFRLKTARAFAEFAMSESTDAHLTKKNELGTHISRTCEKRSNDLGDNQMTVTQKTFNDVTKEQSRIKGKLLELRLTPEDKRTPEMRGEETSLTQQQKDVEDRFTPALEALEAEQNTTTDNGGEGAERRALIERTDFGAYLDSSLSGRALNGPAAELNAACGAIPQEQGVPVPWEVLAGCRAPVEKRADATTALPANGNMTVEQEYVGRLFAGSSSEFLMARTVMLAAGSVSIPVIESGPTAEYFADSAVADADASGVSFKTADPTRLQASVVLRAADIRRSPGLVAGIQTDLAMATADAVDKKIITQLFADLTDATEASAIVSYENFVQALAVAVDGKAANGLGQVRALLGYETYRLAAGKISTNGDLSAVDYAAARAGGIFVSSNMPAKTSTRQKAILAKTGAPGSVASVFFGAGELLNDPWTLSQKGERRLSLLSFHQVLTLRKPAFAEASFKLS